MSPAAKGHILRGCPNCFNSLPISVLQQGNVYCGSCAHEFRATVFEPAEPAAPVIQPLDSTSAASCAKHARNAAVGACESCGSFICALCRIESGGRVICPACFDRERSAGPMVSTFTSWRSLAGYSALGSVFVWPLAVIFGPLAVFSGVRAMVQDRKAGDESWFLGPLICILTGLGGMTFATALTFGMIKGLLR